MIESLLKPRIAENHPERMLLLGLIYSLISTVLTALLLPSEPYLVVFLTALASAVLVYELIVIEEKEGEKTSREKTRLRHHSKVFSGLLMLFIGFSIGFTIGYLLFPQSLFKPQIDAINTFNPSTTSITTMGKGIGYALELFSHNLGVLIVSIIFSFLYGLGAVYILSWNASVLGVALGDLVKDKIVLAINKGLGIKAVLIVGILGFSRFFIHGTIEILAYIVGGLAGGIIGIGMLNHDYKSKEFKKVMMDSLDMVIISIALLFIAALVEAFVTPTIYGWLVKAFGV